jgi:phospholipid-binding lipoprotein MlaA
MANARTGSLIVQGRLILAMLALALASGCATTNGTDPRDPIEGFNRAMYGFNEGFDEAIGKPVATAYRDVLPSFVRTGVRNVFSNIDDLFIGVNNLLQGKFIDATTDLARLAFNTVFGLFGLIDIGSDIGWEKHNEDFGQTFGRWGAGDGPYIVWPFFGSSTVRDSIGSVLDVGLDPVRNHRPVDARNLMLLTRATGRRADLLDASRVLEEAALDKYVFQRDAHLQRRRSLIHDGNPPREDRSSRGAREPQAESGPGEHSGQVNDPVSSSVGASYGARVPSNYDAVLAASANGDADDAEQRAPAR